MKKRVILTVLLMLIFTASLVSSANWFDKITGKATSEVSSDKIPCTDFDNGLNYYVRGQTTNLSEVFDDRCSKTTGMLEEGYCNSSSIAIQDYECPSYCQDGVCVYINEGNVTSTITNESTPSTGIKIAIVDENAVQSYILNGGIEIYQTSSIGGIGQTILIASSDTEKGEVFFNLSLGNYSVRASAPDYFEKLQSFTIQSSDINLLIIPLEKKTIFNCLVLYPNHNGNIKDRINIILIPNNVQNIQLFTQRAKEIINLNANNTEGLLSDVPLMNYKNDFNIFYIDNTNYSGPYQSQEEYCPEIISNRQYIFLRNSNLSMGVANGCNGKTASVDINLDSNYSLNDERFVISHEFGHSFGCLFDEYLYNGNYYTSPPESYGEFAGNCASATSEVGCSKWCSGKPKSIQELSSTDCTASTLTECSSKWNNGLFCVWENEQCTNLIQYCNTFLELNACVNAIGITINEINGTISQGNHKCSWMEERDAYFNTTCIPIIPALDIGNNCLSGTGCYVTCSNPNWFRSSLHGKMRDGGPFGSVDEEILIEKINSYKINPSLSSSESRPDFIFYDKIESNGEILQGMITKSDFLQNQKLTKTMISSNFSYVDFTNIDFLNSVENNFNGYKSQGTFTNCLEGCLLEKKCFPLGYRKEGNYCSDKNKFIIQNKPSVSCENSFECDSNLCVDNKCISSSVWNKFLSWFSKLFGKN